jgi:hypothetical protein
MMGHSQPKPFEDLGYSMNAETSAYLAAERPAVPTPSRSYLPGPSRTDAPTRTRIAKVIDTPMVRRPLVAIARSG